MPVLRSFVNGRWTAPPDGQPVRDAVTGEVRWDAEVIKQDGSVVATYDVLTMVAKEW